MTRGTTYTTTNNEVYQTLNAAIAAGKREYSPAQNKTHSIAIAVAAAPQGGYWMETLPAGYPLPSGYAIVCRNMGGKWKEFQSAIRMVLDSEI
jgi:hypothetical protein